MRKKPKNPYLYSSLADEEHVLDKIWQYSEEEEKKADVNRQIAAIRKGSKQIRIGQENLSNPHGRILEGQDNQDMLDVFAGKKDFFKTEYGKKVSTAPGPSESRAALEQDFFKKLFKENARAQNELFKSNIIAQQRLAKQEEKDIQTRELHNELLSRQTKLNEMTEKRLAREAEIAEKSKKEYADASYMSSIYDMAAGMGSIDKTTATLMKKRLWNSAEENINK